MSNEQKKFLKSIKRRKLIVVISQILIVVAFFVIWEYLANKNIINSFVFSKPSKIFNTIINLAIDNNFNLECIGCSFDSNINVKLYLQELKGFINSIYKLYKKYYSILEKNNFI